jgi:hypothetical protein
MLMRDEGAGARGVGDVACSLQPPIARAASTRGTSRVGVLSIESFLQGRERCQQIVTGITGTER